MKLKLLLMVAVLTMVQSLSAQPADKDGVEAEKIRKLILKFSSYIVASEYDSIALSYTPDGKIFPGNQSIISGRDDIKKYWVLPVGMKTISHTVQPVEIKIVADTAYDYGYYEVESTRNDGSSTRTKGKYVIIWKHTKDGWKIYLDIWNKV